MLPNQPIPQPIPHPSCIMVVILQKKTVSIFIVITVITDAPSRKMMIKTVWRFPEQDSGFRCRQA
jgi:hypothetical protein